jgi:AcrR family transcriptional regulator
MSPGSLLYNVTMSSRPVDPPRRIPRQQRGERRVTALLDAAASVIADSGYDGATMSEIAERAGACIGSLYQFFPNKESITEALRTRYCQELCTLWAGLEEAERLSTNQLVRGLLNETIRFIDDRPAIPYLLNLHPRVQKHSIRDLLRGRIARILRASAPSLSKSRAFVLSMVILQVMKGMNELYEEATKRAAKSLIREYENVLVSYLNAQTGLAKGPARSSRKK